ncbi:outer membrane beta-barrel protein [Zhongshania sp.]|uniref:outer membrane beta-barrel protein n=1 Tax=Zhongshania sp. TaxID=1971902 RepID=UPI001B68DC0F|nr:outer membrane beta-barrel protein [Zhongshania sp.]MBQ0797065.1 outer membrane beta-barrel protein [Zhongshania sp.]
MHGMLRLTSAVVFLLTSLTAFAKTNSSHPEKPFIRGIVTSAITHGGDDIAKVQFKNADSEKIKAGDLLMIGGGILISPPQSLFSVQLTVNYYFDSIIAKNGDASFDRYPVELLVFVNPGRHRVGAGITEHFSPRAELDFDGQEKSSAKFDDATGLILQYDYKLTDDLFLGLRYTAITYTASDNQGADVDGDNVGLTALYQF